MLSNIRKLSILLRGRERLKVLLLALLMIVTALAQMAGVGSVMPFLAVLSDPAMIQQNAWLSHAYDALGFQSTSRYLHFLGITAFVLFITATTLQATTQWMITRFSHTQQYNLSRRLMEDYLRRPYLFFLSRNSGDLSKTLLQETSQAVSGALMPAMQMLSHSLTAIAIIALLLIVEPWLALAVATVLGSIYGTLYLSARAWLHRIGKERVAANRKRYTAAAEAFAGAKEIRLLGREHAYLERYRKPSKLYARHQANASLLSSLPHYVIEGIAFGGILLMVLYLMADGGSLAEALPIIGLYALAGRQLIPAFQKLFGAVSSLRFNMPAVDNVLKDLSPASATGTPPPPLDDHVTPLQLERAITVNNLSFAYPASDRPALNKLSLCIPARTTVGFVGASGAGKSTLIDLLLGLLDPAQGQILIDDVPLGPHNIRSWQAAVGYVPQHIFLADQSVAENIALGVPKSAIDKPAVERAARLANLHDFIVSELPHAYATEIGERGVRLSGGQRQRIGIARALYRNPAVLLFDEATSALDNTTEHAVMSAIHNLAGEKTIILVAHRLTTVQPCDRIFVLANGQVVEEGSWDDLFQKDTRLHRLAVGAN